MQLRNHSWRGQNLRYIVELMVWNWKWCVKRTFSWWKCEELGNFIRNSIDFWIYTNWIWMMRNWVGMWPGSWVIVQELNGCISVGTWTEWFHSGISIPKPWISSYVLPFVQYKLEQHHMHTHAESWKLQLVIRTKFTRRRNKVIHTTKTHGCN